MKKTALYNSHLKLNAKMIDFAGYLMPVQYEGVNIEHNAVKNNVGILVCGSGMGMNIAANRHRNIRAAQCFNIKSTKLSRLHNDANIITLGSRLISKKNALNFIGVFLKTKFEGGRHSKRIRKI